MKLENLEQVQRAIELLYQIKNNGDADFTTNLCAYSCVNTFDIDLHVDKWTDTPHVKINLTIYMQGKSDQNEATLAKLEDYANNGFDSDSAIKAQVKDLLKQKKELFAKLSKELSEVSDDEILTNSI